MAANCLYKSTDYRGNKFSTRSAAPNIILTRVAFFSVLAGGIPPCCVRTGGGDGCKIEWYLSFNFSMVPFSCGGVGTIVPISGEYFGSYKTQRFQVPSSRRIGELESH